MLMAFPNERALQEQGSFFPHTYMAQQPQQLMQTQRFQPNSTQLTMVSSGYPHPSPLVSAQPSSVWPPMGNVSVDSMQSQPSTAYTFPLNSAYVIGGNTFVAGVPPSPVTTAGPAMYAHPPSSGTSTPPNTQIPQQQPQQQQVYILVDSSTMGGTGTSGQIFLNRSPPLAATPSGSNTYTLVASPSGCAGQPTPSLSAMGQSHANLSTSCNSFTFPVPMNISVAAATPTFNSNSPNHQMQSLQPQPVQPQQQTRPLYDVRTWGFAVVDQLHSLLPRVPVPPSVVCEHTKGVSLYNNDVMTSSTRPCNSSVCLLYSNTGRCPSGPECRAFHISPTYLQQSRALTEPLCCALHNCFYSQEMLASECAPGLRKQRYCVLLDTPAFMPNPTAEPRAVELSVLHLSLTVGLETLALKGDRRLISLRRQVCRLHLEGKCKWTKDCGHVHICRELLPLLESPELLDFLDAVQGRQESHQKLFLRIQSSVKVRQYVRSVAVLPMLTQLINLRCTEALKALALAKVACIMTQYEELLRLGLVHNASEVTWVQVNEKIAPFLRPGVAADGDSVATGTPSHSPHAQQALNERCV